MDASVVARQRGDFHQRARLERIRSGSRLHRVRHAVAVRVLVRRECAGLVKQCPNIGNTISRLNVEHRPATTDQQTAARQQQNEPAKYSIHEGKKARSIILTGPLAAKADMRSARRQSRTSIWSSELRASEPTQRNDLLSILHSFI